MNKARPVVAALAIVLAGCAAAPRAGAFPALCDTRCLAPCIGPQGDTGVRWESAPDDPAGFDALGETVIPVLAEKLRRCELHRQACEQCLRRLDKQSVIAL
ncbi:hypothetical protein [Lysobacter sp. CA196]|uniref:hypothetical protein n=1 Tax=Lysobacter sp. CA196 TaxID=3455606 RepID=UPI003F8D596E